MIEQLERRGFKTGKGMSNAPLGVLVDVDILILAGFNYERHSFSVPNGKGGIYLVHATDPESKLSDLLIIEEQNQRGAIKWREWYIGRVVGAPIHEQSFEDREAAVRLLAQFGNWVHSSELSRAVEQEIDKTLGGAE